MAEFSTELFNTICERIASGESLRKICSDSDMPSTASVMRWLAADGEKQGTLREQYARAMEARADFHFEEMFQIADTPVEGVRTKIKEDGSVEEQRGDMIEHRRLQVDVRKWALARMQPKKYGDKLDIDAKVATTINLPSGSQNV